jgi:hypothetical protein
MSDFSSCDGSAACDYTGALADCAIADCAITETGVAGVCSGTPPTPWNCED